MSHERDHQAFDLSLDSIVFAIPIAGYIYSPFEQLPNYAPPTRFVFFPIIVLMGLWMWKGHVVRRLFETAGSGTGVTTASAEINQRVAR